MPADTHTPTLRMTLQGVGNNNTTWGDIIDANLLILENAIAGVTSIDVSSGDVTLTETQYAHAVLIFTGTLSDDTSVTVFNRAKTFIVVDLTPFSAFNLTIGVPGGSTSGVDDDLPGAFALTPGVNIVFLDGENHCVGAG